jgi:MoeA N-terminal region (domain I and II)
MIGVDEAQARLLALAPPLPAVELPIAQAVGHYLAEDVIARRTQPAVDLSAMDGYAIRFAELPGPWRVILLMLRLALAKQSASSPARMFRRVLTVSWCRKKPSATAICCGWLAKARPDLARISGARPVILRRALACWRAVMC